jgi:uncharacterized repeat protein (TIGR03803 family)
MNTLHRRSVARTFSAFVAILWLFALVAMTIPCRANDVYQAIRSFGFTNLMGHAPRYGVIETSDGILYGTTPGDNIGGDGVLFRVNRDGTSYAALHHFSGPEDGVRPNGIIQAADGALYGTTVSVQGMIGGGTIFKINPDGSGYTIVKRFDNGTAEGEYPASGLLEASDGKFYGTTQYGGVSNAGTIFQVNPNGSDYRVLRHFGASNNDGRWPIGGLIEGSDLFLYGTTSSGGLSNWGTIFRLNKDGTGYKVLRELGTNRNDGSRPVTRLLEGRDGLLYGVTPTAGDPVMQAEFGVVFRLRKDGSDWSILRRLDRGTRTELIQGPDGAFYGTTLGLYWLSRGEVFRISEDGGEYAIIKTLEREPSGDGGYPSGPLLITSEGLLYGTTERGGRSEDGTIYSLATNGMNYQLRYSFHATGGDGQAPNEVIQGSDGWWYGTTREGGARHMGCIFKIDSSGSNYAILRSLGGTGSDGENPGARVIEGSNGVLYGSTVNGGSDCYGVIYRIEKSGSNYTILKHFSASGGDARQPSGLLEGSDGLLYGTTGRGGASDGGTVFRIRKDGAAYQILHEFGDGPGGGAPSADLIEVADGILYGVTSQNGAVFSLKKDGSDFRALQEFVVTNGYNPRARLIEGSDGLLYGTTSQGGANIFGGSIFRLRKDGSGYTTLRHFHHDEFDASTPQAALVETRSGLLYGTTQFGGASAVGGTVFRINADGGGFRVIKDFLSYEGDGYHPTAALQKGNDGCLYGTTSSGGISRLGLVYRIVPAPALSIAVVENGSAVQCSWSVSPLRWTLYGEEQFDSSGWNRINASYVTNGTRISATTSIGTIGFFRLQCED